MDFSSNNIVFQATAYHGIKMAREKGVAKLWVKGDSLNIFNCLRNCSPPSWTIENFIVDVQAMLHDFNEVYISHAFHEANGVAH